MSDQIDISREACERSAQALHELAEPFGKPCAEGLMITALRAALDAAEAERVRAVEAERERCAVICEEQAQVFGSEEYAFGQPMSSFKERFACKSIAAEIRNGTNPSTCYCGRAVCSYEADTGCGAS